MMKYDVPASSVDASQKWQSKVYEIRGQAVDLEKESRSQAGVFSFYLSF